MQENDTNNKKTILKFNIILNENGHGRSMLKQIPWPILQRTAAWKGYQILCFFGILSIDPKDLII